MAFFLGGGVVGGAYRRDLRESRGDFFCWEGGNGGKEKLQQMGLIVLPTQIKERDICSRNILVVWGN